ncbi:M48 family metalloprotease [Chthonobacter rhizosphaerae]|uniref:M48 family metalloprotease n=1 Tax=Chthonobacter rhizosphaerae TaxID=2735553 RepID=UPI0015EE9088|nr:M48 family metalloprotease [Chthonobacter rhizosphaerae]
MTVGRQQGPGGIRRLLKAGSALALSLALAGCVGALGGRSIDEAVQANQLAATPRPASRTPEVDAREVAIAEREHPKILASFGGTYEDPEAEVAIARAVGRLVRASDEPWRSYRVTILNSPAINAFALPGGYVYVTRGLLALANDTSEVAAVIAHEMAHVTARHAFARAERAEAAAVASRVVQDVVQDPAVARLALASTQMSLARFSQIQELDADAVGIRTLARSGYDPYAAARFLTSMSRFAAYKTASPADDGSADFLSSHPSTPERIAQANAAAAAAAVAAGGDRDQDAYLKRVDGLMFGDDPVEGFVRGREFLHAKLGLAFAVPAGFTLENTARAVLATDRGGTAMRFDGADVKAGDDLIDYLTSGWINGLDPASVQTLSINGMPAATASAAARGYTYRVAVVRFGDQTFRFLFATRSLTPDFDRAFRETIGSFRPLGADEQARLQPLRIRIATVQPGDTAESLAARMAPVDRAVDLFRVFNGLGAGEQPAVGRKVKLIVDG